MFTRFSVTDSHIKSLDFFGLPSMPIARSLQTSVGTTLSSTIWTLAGGYTVLRGQWGNLDVIAGLRLLAVNATTDFNLALMVSGPRGNGTTFGGIGGVSGSQDIWNGIGGLRGRIRLGDTHLFIPYYFDAGAGGSQFTWQTASGLGYQIKWAAISRAGQQRSRQTSYPGRADANGEFQLLEMSLVGGGSQIKRTKAFAVIAEWRQDQLALAQP